MAPFGLRLSLRYRLVAAFLVALAPLVLLGVLDLRRNYAERRESVLEERLLTAQALSALVDASFDQAMDLAKILASDPVIGSLDSSRLDSYLTRYSPSFPEYDSINVWDATGANVGASAPQPPGEARPSIADRDHFQRTMATGEPGISAVLQARTTNRPSVAVVTVIRGPSGRRDGAVTVLMDLSRLPSRLTHPQLEPDHSILVADRAGTLAVDTSRPNLRWDERDASRYRPVADGLRLGYYAGIEEGLASQEAQVVAVARSPRYGWIVGTAAPEAKVLGPVGARAAEQAAVVGLAVLAAALLAAAFTLSITRPLRELTGAITDFGAGRMSRRAGVHTGDELETAADTFNEMAATLERQRRRLEFFGRLSAGVSASLDLEWMTDVLAREIAAATGQQGFACLLDEDSRSCRIHREHVVESPSDARAVGPADGEIVPSLVEQVLVSRCAKGQAVFVRDVESAWGDDDLQVSLAALGVGSIIAVPLTVYDRTVGIVGALSLDGEALTGEHLEMVRGASEIGGVAVENGLLYEELDRERRSLDTLIDRMGEGITIADGSGQILHLNRRARELLGHPPVVEGKLWLTDHLKQVNLFYPDGGPVPFEERPIARALRGETFSGEEGIVVRPDGSRSHLLFSSGVVRDESGVRMAMTIYMDITQIREMERAREEFISVVAHDLRSPITTIAGFADLLKGLPDSNRGGAREKKALENIASASRRLERMVADLLDASRIESRRLKVSKVSLDLERFLPEVVERAAAHTEGHPVRLASGRDVPGVDADPGRLEQIMVNLLTNAAKYSPPGSEIVVETGGLPGEALISVVNQGEGIAPEEREAVFSRFYRTSAAERSSAPGTGLGLYITKGLVEAHGGRIWVDGEAGRYVAIRFTLPAAREG